MVAFQVSRPKRHWLGLCTTVSDSNGGLVTAINPDSQIPFHSGTHSLKVTTCWRFVSIYIVATSRRAMMGLSHSHMAISRSESAQACNVLHFFVDCFRYSRRISFSTRILRVTLHQTGQGISKISIKTHLNAKGFKSTRISGANERNVVCKSRAVSDFTVHFPWT